MAQQIINTGTSELSGDGESIRSAFQKSNSNFTELYASTNLSNISTSLLPSATLTHDIGSPSRQWRSLYVGTSTIYLGGTAVSAVGSNLTINGSPVSADTGNLRFRNDTLYNYNGLLLNNASASTGSTVQISIPSNNSNNDLLITNNSKNWAFKSNGQLTFPLGTVVSELVSGPSNLFGIFANAVPGRDVLIRTSPVPGVYNQDFIFRTDGRIQLPSGGDIVNSSGASVLGVGPLGISSLTNSGYSLQLLVGGGQPYVMFPPAYGTQMAIQGNEIAAQDTSTLVLSAGGSGLGNVQINVYNPTANAWVFGNDTVLTFPSGFTMGPEGMGGFGLSNGITGNTLILANKNLDGNYLADISVSSGDGTSGNITFNIWNTQTLTSKTLTINTSGGFVLPNGVVLKDTVNSSIGLGVNAGQNNQGVSSIAIGTTAGENTQSAATVAIGFRAGRNNQGQGATAVGASAGPINQSPYAVAIGFNAGYTDQSTSSVAIGYNAGFNSQGTLAVAIGKNAGNTSQNYETVAIGNQAGEIGQGSQSTAVGSGAGNYSQSNGATAIGALAGSFQQGLRAVAIGSLAGSQNQGAYAVALGNFAGGTNQPANSIVINASGVALNGSTSGLFIDPIRADSSATTHALFYNANTKEITTSSLTSITLPADEAFAITTSFTVLGSPPAGPTSFNWQFQPNGYLTLPAAGGIETALDENLLITVNYTAMSSPPGPSSLNYIFNSGGKLEFPSTGLGVAPGITTIGSSLDIDTNGTTWTFDQNGKLYFPDNTAQTTAYQKTTSTFNTTTSTNVDVDNFRASFNGSGNPAVGAVYSNFTCTYTLNRTLFTSSTWNVSAVGSSVTFSTTTTTTLGTTFTAVGDQVVGTFQDFTGSKIYKATWIKSAAGARGSIIVERLI